MFMIQVYVLGTQQKLIGKSYITSNVKKKKKKKKS